ncbi:MAG: hypothetical protein Kow00114_03440 [Kiloniellaceae bacterium]
MVNGPRLRDSEGEAEMTARPGEGLRPGGGLRGAIGAALLLGLAACSTTDYSKPVNDFAAATGNAEKALADLNAQVTTAYRQVLTDAIRDNDVRARPASGDCLTRSERCRLALIDRQGAVQEFYPPEPPLVQLTAVMGQISGYAQNLKALLEADSASKVAGSVNAALGSVQNLAETVAKADTAPGATPEKIPQFATPTAAAVNWIAGQYIESVKYRGLQRATKEAKPVIRKAADIFSTTSAFISDVPRAQLADEVAAADDAYRANRNDANLDKLVKAAAKYDALLSSTPPDLFKRLGDAHDALADSLQGDAITIGEAIGKIEAFAAEAQKLAKILKDIRAIVPNEGEG